jgi:hypothetical protein
VGARGRFRCLVAVRVRNGVHFVHAKYGCPENASYPTIANENGYSGEEDARRQ